MSQQLYTNASIYINSRHLAEQASVKVSRKSGANPVHTQGKGFAGMSPGSPFMEIQVESAVPAVDFEMDPGQFHVGRLVPFEVTVFAAGRTLTSTGWTTEDDFSSAVNSESKLNFTIIAEPAKWE